jgi:hypothetical protein
VSKYKRDDEKFREQIAALATAGLVLGDNTCSLYRARPCNECSPVVEVPMPDMSEMYGSTKENLKAHGFSMKDYPTNFNGVPAYMRVIEPTRPTLEIAPKGKLPEFVAGLIAGGIIVAIGLLAFKALVFIWSVIL